MLQTGGTNFLAISKAAIAQSDVTKQFAGVVARTVSSADKLFAGGSANSGGSTLSGNGGGAGGGTYGKDNVFSGTVAPVGGALVGGDVAEVLVSGDINDNDSEATDT